MKKIMREHSRNPSFPRKRESSLSTFLKSRFKTWIPAFAGLTIVLFSVATVSAAAGKSGLGFLKLGNGARAAGMGETQTALSEASNAIYWNPAGLGLTTFRELTLTQLQHFEDSTQQYAAVALPLKKGKAGGLGLSVSRFAIENIEARDAQSTRLPEDVEQEDLSLQLSYGFRLGSASNGFDRDGLFLGVGAKRISEKLAGVSADAFAFDVGGQYRPTETVVRSFGEWARRLSLGVAVLNLGKGPTFDQEETPLPQSTRFGLAYTHFLWGDAFNLATDLEVPREGGTKLSGGAEFWIRNLLALRVGYVEGQDVGDEIRFGTGFRFQMLQVDYALARFGDVLGDTHRFTLTMRFGDGAHQTQAGLKSDLVQFHLSEAQEYLSVGSYHEAVLEANRVLEVDPRNPQALQILVEAGEKMKPVSPLPEPTDSPTEEKR